jgi:hypothetical protein
MINIPLVYVLLLLLFRFLFFCNLSFFMPANYRQFLWKLTVSYFLFTKVVRSLNCYQMRYQKGANWTLWFKVSSNLTWEKKKWNVLPYFWLQIGLSIYRKYKNQLNKGETKIIADVSSTYSLCSPFSKHSWSSSNLKCYRKWSKSAWANSWWVRVL